MHILKKVNTYEDRDKVIGNQVWEIRTSKYQFMILIIFKLKLDKSTQEIIRKANSRNVYKLCTLPTNLQ